MNEKQKKAITNKGFTDSQRTYRQMDDSWYRSGIYRGADYIQQQAIPNKVPTSQNLLN